MEFDKIHFKLNKWLQPVHKLPLGHVSVIKQATPEPLYVLCSHVCDDLPLPEAFKWNNMHVLQWIERLGFPQYRNTFYENKINGRSLLLVDANALCHMNIRDFDHITSITAAIRQLYRIELVLFARSISLPPRYPHTHYKLFRVFTGPTYERTKCTELFNRMHLLQPAPPNRNHWRKLHEWLQHQPQTQKHRIGYAPRHQLYKVPRDLHPPKRASSNRMPSVVDASCHCMPPCECQWQPWYYREPWTLRCLLGDAADELNGPLADGDVIVAEMPSTQAEGLAVRNAAKCGCALQHECEWRRSDAPRVLTVVRAAERVICEVDFGRGVCAADDGPAA